MAVLRNRQDIEKAVRKAVRKTPVLDIHTHIYPPAFGELLLWGIDEVLTYHYLVAEVFRHRPMPYERFWAMTKKEQANLIWEHLFLKNSPISEACRGVLTGLQSLGLEVEGRDLEAARRYFESLAVEDYVDEIFAKTNVSSVIMTNDPFDERERAVWTRGFDRDARFRAALRLDALLMEWPRPVVTLKEQGYRVQEDLGTDTLAEVKRFLHDWAERMQAVYLAVSLPPDFRFPEDSPRSRLMEQAVLPAARERGVPLAMMIGVKKRINPGLRDAGDGVGKADNRVLERMCRDYPDNRFLLTYLSRENQHELCVTARKFANLHPFGCWWFLNNPSIVEEITRERVELLGTSFTPQHSDARVLDQLLFKWAHAREVIAKVLTDNYARLAATGWSVEEEEIRRDAAHYFGGAFEKFLKETPRS